MPLLFLGGANSAAPDKGQFVIIVGNLKDLQEVTKALSRLPARGPGMCVKLLCTDLLVEI